MRIKVTIEKIDGVMVEEVEYQDMNPFLNLEEQIGTFNTIAEYIYNKLVMHRKQKGKNPKKARAV